MDNEQYINVRFESINHKKMVNEIKHDLRMNKITSVSKPDIPTYIFYNDNGELKEDYFFMQTEKSKKYGNEFINKLESIEDRHRKLLRINSNQSLNKNRVNSYNMGVLTFSDSMRELVRTDLHKVLQLGKKTIENICNELDIDLHYISFHMDEEGIPHFHYFTDNFNSKGKTISPKKNKNLGQRLQDLGAEYFNELGFKRGISKEETGKKHLSIEEYKEYQDTRNLQQEMLENTLLLVSDFYEMGMNYKGKSQEDLMKLFQRYFNDNTKFEKLLDKVLNLAERQGFDLSNYTKVNMSDLVQKMKENNKNKSNNKGDINPIK